MRDASAILAKIMQDHPCEDIFAKIDCEGSEYEIVDSLVRNGLLRSLASAAIECHEGKVDVIDKQLKHHGFQTSRTVIREGETEFIYAVRMDS